MYLSLDTANNLLTVATPSINSLDAARFGVQIHQESAGGNPRV